MNNPDWRRRRAGCSSCEFTATGSGMNHARPSSSEISHKVSEKRAISYMNNGNISAWAFIDGANQSQLSLCSSEPDIKDSNVSSTNEEHGSLSQDNIEPTESKSIGNAMGGLCIVRFDVDLVGGQYKGRQLRVFEVSPIPLHAGNTQDHGTAIASIDREAPIAYIQRVVGKRPRTEQGTENHLDESGPTPRHASLTKFSNGSSLYDEKVGRAREALLKDPSVTKIGSGHVNSQSKIMSRLPLPMEQSRESEEVERRKAAFRKILHKLQQGSKLQTESTKRNAFSASSRLRGYPWGPRSSRHSSSFAQQHSSDSGIGSLYSDPPTRRDASSDSGIRIDSDVLTYGLNPRAREFLSFKKGFSAESQSQEIINFSDEDVLKTILSDHINFKDERNFEKPVETESRNLDIPMPVLQSDTNVNSTGNTSNPEFSTADTTKQDVGEFNYSSKVSPTKFGVPLGACGTSVRNILPPGVLPGLGLGGILPTPATFGSPPNPSMIEPLMQQYSFATGPFMGNYALPQMLFNPTLRSGCFPARPQPIPKPTNPDPIQQQQYEEYIEWRKANEPGYALACKSRQQRRAQRGSTTQAPPLLHSSNDGARTVQ
ncbi:hypothetical protein FBEOM_567 [Fusarium beomiforme]|uniref:Uncharacterized protein n=1 Tax=Fusarium beomiforme TaxID=44412 RepID=A0A9P5AVG3_9HYPO|nr:hypothetical protein FBEOM_567 [Fusarium beomiforme]